MEKVPVFSLFLSLSLSFPYNAFQESLHGLDKMVLTVGVRGAMMAQWDALEPKQGGQGSSDPAWGAGTLREGRC